MVDEACVLVEEELDDVTVDEEAVVVTLTLMLAVPELPALFVSPP